MGNIYASGFSANKVWDGIIYHHSHDNITPLAGPKFLWDARISSLITLEGANSVTAWADYYQGKILNQYFGPDVSKAPTYEVVSGIQTVHFNGVNNYLASYPFGETSSDFTIFVVVTDLQTNMAVDNGQIFFIFNGGDNIDMEYVAMNQIGTVISGVDMGLFLAQPKQIMAVRISGGTVGKVYQNGGTPSTQAVSMTGVDFLGLGSFIGNRYLYGNIPCVAYYDSALSDVDMNTAFSYAGAAFGITVTPVS